jgi:P pilus assembly chaperone PapD
MPLCAPHRNRRTLIALAMLLVGTTAQAQISIDRKELVLRPDSLTQRNGVMIVRNTGRMTTGAVIRVEDWDRGADGAHRFYDAGTQPGSCASVLTIAPLEFTLAPGESRAIQIGVDGVVNSACWSLVLVEAEERVRDEHGKVILAVVRTGMKVYAEPSDSRALGIVSEVEVETSEAAHSSSVTTTAATSTAVTAAVTFRNTGDRHLRGMGHVEIRRADDSVLATLPLPELQTLPGATATARVVLPATLKGTYRLRAVVNYGGPSSAAAEREAAIP